MSWVEMLIAFLTMLCYIACRHTHTHTYAYTRKPTYTDRHFHTALDNKLTKLMLLCLRLHNKTKSASEACNVTHFVEGERRVKGLSHCTCKNKCKNMQIVKINSVTTESLKRSMDCSHQDTLHGTEEQQLPRQKLCAQNKSSNQRSHSTEDRAHRPRVDEASITLLP